MSHELSALERDELWLKESGNDDINPMEFFSQVTSFMGDGKPEHLARKEALDYWLAKKINPALV